MRDLLLGKIPKDFDITTNATPEQIKNIFGRQCRIIGRRFKLAHIMFGREIFEVATFRADHQKAVSKGLSQNIASQEENGIIKRDNVYGSIFDDAKRRDFTINALYYDVKTNQILDFYGGIKDISDGRLRLIGDPEIRYREDPVRMLRAIRFMAKLDFFMQEDQINPILDLKEMLNDMPKARLFDESIKLLQSGKGIATFNLMKKYGLFQILLPNIAAQFTTKGDSLCEKMIFNALQSTDERWSDNLSINPVFLFAAMLWYPMREKMEQYKNELSISNQDAMMMAANDVILETNQTLLITKFQSSTIKDIWLLQFAMMKRNLKAAMKTVVRPKFRAGYDLLLMRSQIEGGELIDIATWWHEFQLSSDVQRQMQLQNVNQKKITQQKKGKKFNYSKRKRKSKPKREDNE